MLGFPVFEAEDDIGVAELLPAPSVSLSLALSAISVRQWRRLERLRGGDGGTARQVTFTRFLTAPSHEGLQ